MAYLVPDDFRKESLNEVVSGYALTTDEATDSELTSAIARLSARIDDYTDDHFEPFGTVLLPETVTVYGSGTTRLYLPMRTTSVVTVTTTDSDDTATVQDVATWRLHSSLGMGGSIKVGVRDWLEVTSTGLDIASTTSGYYYSPYTWPRTWPVTVTGIFGWTVTPGDIKQALALLVYHHFKPIRKDLGFMTRITTADQASDFADKGALGVPDANDLVTPYVRETMLGVA